MLHLFMIPHVQTQSNRGCTFSCNFVVITPYSRLLDHTVQKCFLFLFVNYTRIDMACSLENFSFILTNYLYITKIAKKVKLTEL
jgi:hypothetical protein